MTTKFAQTINACCVKIDGWYVLEALDGALAIALYTGCGHWVDREMQPVNIEYRKVVARIEEVAE